MSGLDPSYSVLRVRFIPSFVRQFTCSPRPSKSHRHTNKGKWRESEQMPPGSLAPGVWSKAFSKMYGVMYPHDPHGTTRSVSGVGHRSNISNVKIQNHGNQLDLDTRTIRYDTLRIGPQFPRSRPAPWLEQ